MRSKLSVGGGENVTQQEFCGVKVLELLHSLLFVSFALYVARYHAVNLAFHFIISLLEVKIVGPALFP